MARHVFVALEEGITMHRIFSLTSLALAVSTGAMAADRYVDTSGSDESNDCAATATPCATISHAVDQANEGDTIKLAAGTWNSSMAYPIEMPDGVSLVGAGASSTKIVGEPFLINRGGVLAGGPGFVTSRFLWIDTVMPFEISGLTVSGEDGSGGDGAFLVYASSQSANVDVVMKDAAVEGLDGYGIALNGYGDVTAKVVVRDSVFDGNRDSVDLSWDDPSADFLITGNTFSNNRDNAVDIFVSGSDETPWGDGSGTQFQIALTNNTFTATEYDHVEITISDYQTAKLNVANNTFTDGGGEGVYLFISSTARVDATFADNTFADNGGEGLEVEMYSNNTVRLDLTGNTFSGNADNGARIVASDYTNVVDLTVTGNTFDGNGDNGLEFGITDSTYNAFRATVEDNTITNNGASGINVLNTYDSTNLMVVDIRSNTIQGNAEDGVRVSNESGAMYLTLYGNVITDNDENGVNFYSASDDGQFYELTHNTIQGNATGYTNSGFYDVDMGDNEYYDVFALDNWWGSTDRAVIDAHINDYHDDSSLGELRYSALSEALAFAPQPSTGPVDGSNVVAIMAGEDAPPFVPSAGINKLVVTFDGSEAQVLEVSRDGDMIFVRPPAHAAGVVDVEVSNPGGQTGTAAASYTYVAEVVVDTDVPTDTDAPTDTDTDDDKVDAEGCGCATGAQHPGGGLMFGLGLLALGLRRRR